MFRKILLASVFALAPFAAFAQSLPTPTQVQQGSQRADAATFLQGPAGGATTCNTVNTTTANGTVTITPPGGLSVYVTGVYVDITSDATGTAGAATMSATNLSGSPFWSLSTGTLTGTQGAFRQISEVFPTGLKSTTPGTAVTFVPSAQVANEKICIRVAGYFAN